MHLNKLCCMNASLAHDRMPCVRCILEMLWPVKLRIPSHSLGLCMEALDSANSGWSAELVLH